MSGRPLLVLTRNRAIPVLDRVTVVPITRTIRRIPTELVLDVEDGVPWPCVALFDTVRQIRKSLLRDYVTNIAHRSHEICFTLAAVADC